MLNISKMISSAQQALGWPYVSPGTNDHNGIDCSGLFVKIFRDQGSNIAHGSNTIYRKYCTEKGFLMSVSQLKPGMAVFKWNPNTPEKFNDGLGDFQHIGLVTNINPLKIIHASSVAGCVTTDTKIGKWKYWGKLKNVDYGGDTMSTKEEVVNETVEKTPQIATVFAESGVTVKMRAKPSTSCKQYWDVPLWTKVEILSTEDENWAKIKCGSRTGYMMSKFLIDENQEEETSVKTSDLRKAYDIIGNCLGQFIVNKGDLEKAYDIIGDTLGLRG